MVSLSLSMGVDVSSSGSVIHAVSSVLFHMSPSLSISVLSPIPSPSKSVDSLASSGNASWESMIPSPSVSLSNASQMPSPSISPGTLVAFSGSVPQAVSMVSYHPSPSVSSVKN